MEGPYIIGLSTAGLSAIMFGLMRWSFVRNITELDARLAAAQKEAKDAKALAEQYEREGRDRFGALEKRFGEEATRATLSNADLKKDLSHIDKAVDGMNTLVKELQRLFETTRDKQAEFYRKELKETETKVLAVAETLRQQVSDFVLAQQPRPPSRPRK